MDTEQKSIKRSIKINIKIAVIIALIVIIGALAYAYKGLFIVAIVDGSPISRLAIVQELEKRSGKSLLDSLVNEKLIRGEASARGIVVSDDEVNNDIKMIEEQFVAQGGTLEAVLVEQGMSMDDLKKQVFIQKEMEKLLAGKINVTDEEVAQYIKDNGISIPEGQEAATADQIKSGIRSQKLNTEAQALITDLKSKAKIRYFVNY